MRTPFTVLASSLLSVLLLSCGSSSTSPSTGGTTPAATITIQDFSFTPSAVTIKVGQTVRWINHGPSTHTSTSDAGVWDSGPITVTNGGSGGGGTGYSMAGGMAASSAAGAFDFTFTQTGTFGFHCSIHPPAQFPGFAGTVTVTQ
jgi:plastocyanin